MPLINRLRPAPLESLDSLVQRLGWANHYQSPHWLTGLLPRRSGRLRPNALERPEDYAALSELTGLAVEVLQTMTLRRFAAAAAESVQFPLERPRTGGAVVCPQCWREHQALLLPWVSSQVTTCRRHGLLLVDRCPGCGACLDLDVRATACRRCSLAIGAFATWSMVGHPDSISLTRLVWGALGCAPDLDWAQELAADDPLRRLAPSSLLHLLETCAEWLVLCSARTPLFASEYLLPGVSWDTPEVRLRSLDIVGVHTALAAAWRLLRNWPALWHAVLPPGPLVDVARSGCGPPAPVVLRTLRGAPAWLPVGRWWPDLLWKRSAEGYPWARFDRPAPAMPSKKERVPWTDLDLQLVQEDAAPYCQLAEPDFEALVEAGLLRAVAGPFAQRLVRWHFTERVLHLSLRALLGTVPVRQLAATGSPTGDLVWLLGRAAPLGIGIVPVMRAVRDGTLPAFRTRPSVHPCHLWFEQAHVARWLP